MIPVNISDIRTQFEEVYTDQQDSYLFPSFHLGYLAGLLPEMPNLAIPGQDAHMIVAAHNGRIKSSILKLNKLSCERAVGKKISKNENSMYSVSSSKSSAATF